MYILLVVDVPKVKLPVAGVLDVTPNVKALVVAGVPKLRPVNKGAEVVGAGNKLGAVVIVVTALVPTSKPPPCACVEVVVVPNPKLRPVDVVEAGRPPNVNVLDVGVVLPNVFVKPKLVAVLDNKNNCNVKRLIFFPLWKIILYVNIYLMSKEIYFIFIIKNYWNHNIILNSI